MDDAFVTKFNPSGSALVYSTYLGGGSADAPYALALDQAGNVYVTGRTNSSDFPLTNPLQTTRTAFDMFVTEINAAGIGPAVFDVHRRLAGASRAAASPWTAWATYTSPGKARPRIFR